MFIHVNCKAIVPYLFIIFPMFPSQIWAWPCRLSLTVSLRGSQFPVGWECVRPSRSGSCLLPPSTVPFHFHISLKLSSFSNHLLPGDWCAISSSSKKIFHFSLNFLAKQDDFDQTNFLATSSKQWPGHSLPPGPQKKISTFLPPRSWAHMSVFIDFRIVWFWIGLSSTCKRKPFKKGSLVHYICI